MTRLALTPTQMVAKYPSLQPAANALDFAWTAAGADYADGASFTLTGKEILLVYNPDSSTHTVTISSVADPMQRTGNITSYVVGIGEYAVFPQFQREGWVQSDGKLYFAADNALVKFAVLRLAD